MGVRWYLLTRATYIISVLARGARGTTGTHGTLEVAGREDVRMTRIRKGNDQKRRGRLGLEEGGKKDPSWWSFNRRVHIFVEGVYICIENTNQGPLTEAPGSPGSPGGPWKPWGP